MILAQNILNISKWFPFPLGHYSMVLFSLGALCHLWQHSVFAIRPNTGLTAKLGSGVTESFFGGNLIASKIWALTH